MPLTRREVIAGGSGGLVWLAGVPALADTAYPSRTIKLIVPYPAGGTTDLLGRLIADQFKNGLSATVIVENKPGAGTTLGADQVAKSEPDGYTLLMATSTTLAINKTLYKKLPYDPVKDFAPIGLVAGVPFALIINPTIPAKTLPQFIAYAKSKPGLAYGSAGNGSPQHLGAEMLKTAAGIDIRHVPYRGSAAGPATDPRGQGQGARRDHAEADRGRAGDSDPRRSRVARVRTGRLAGRGGAGRHAAADHRSTGRTTEQAVGRSRDARET